ncbi:MAG: TIGR03619 family F420-dependent LLM class oxidoreductase [Chloroflexi bacterium]|nr:TIGR03619 family F420-dependent LLM class oxidoreductase [Chloroflexota bacterium]
MMKFGIPIGNFGTAGKFGGINDVIDIAERAELLGYDSVWVHDHIFMPATIKSRYPYNDSGVAGFAYHQDIMDPLAVMSAVAIRTSEIQIGTSVLIIPYRDPLYQAQAIATIDQLSEGRVLLGIGVGWMEEEFAALGLEGEPFTRRGAMTDEWMSIAISAWTHGVNREPISHEGHFRQFDDLGGMSACHQQPHVPIWVGGKGRIAARRVARYGSGYHTITSTPDQIRDRRGRDGPGRTRDGGAGGVDARTARAARRRHRSSARLPRRGRRLPRRDSRCARPVRGSRPRPRPHHPRLPHPQLGRASRPTDAGHGRVGGDRGGDPMSRVHQVHSG